MRTRARGVTILAAGLLVGLGFFAAGLPALAQSGEQADLARQFTHELLGAADFTGLFVEGAESAFPQSPEHPDWHSLAVEALKEEIAADQQQIEAVMAGAIAKDFSADELRAGLVVLKAPEIRAAVAAAAKHQPIPPLPNPPCSAECMSAMQSPGGRSFGAKIGNLGVVFTADTQQQITSIVQPGVMKRFAAKAQAYQASH